MDKSFGKNMFFNFIKTLSGTIFPIITFSYASRILGEDGIGKVNFAKTIITYFTVLALLGMKFYGTRETAKRRDDRRELSIFVHEMLMINGATTVLAYLLLILAILSVRKLQDYTGLLLLNSLAIVLNGMGMEWLYQGLEEYQYISVRAMLFQILALILMFILVRDESDVMGYAFVYLLSTSGSYVLNFIYAKRFVSFQWYGNYQPMRHLKPILWLFAMAVSIELYTMLDTTMLGFLQDDATVGRYTVAVRVNKMVSALIVSLEAVFSPRLAYYFDKNRKSELNELLRKTYQYMFLLAVPSAIGLFLLSNEIIQIISGSGFGSAVITMRILTPLVMLIPFDTMTNDQIFVSLGKEKLIVISTGIGAVTNFIGNLLFIPRFAENGAAFATVLAESSVALVSYFNVRRNLHAQIFWRGYSQYWIASIPIFVICGISSMLHIGVLSRILVVVPVSVIGYFYMLHVLGNEYADAMIEDISNKMRIGRKGDG